MREASLVSSSIARLVAALLTLAVVVVPSVMRARQHVELREGTRLSIRLNWESDAPPQRALPDAASRDDAAVVDAVVIDPEPRRISRAECLTAEPVPQTPFDNAPDFFRGPPSLFI